eukprot:TRINITY_DN21327_c0_g1_i8.p2 TRINITY_DN21327_c0_g1~~TRINITY_DN21327_c0_g1_i8.p2  ORF type:complete len:236 (+),score=18.42 TRINITY_DN21327_c0_g1_i8:114-821(+)
MIDQLKAYLTEFIGTFFFQIIGGSAGGVNTMDTWAVSACLNGIGLIPIVYMAFNVSGGHVNPAVSLGLTVQGSLHWFDFILYTTAQIMGAICGAAILKWFLPEDVDMCPPVQDIGMAYVAELIFTFILLVVVIACAVPKVGNHGSLAPIAIGLIVFVAVVTVGGISGAYLNPARLIGPNLIFGCSNGWWLILAQLPGGALGGAYGSLMYGFGPHYNVKKQDYDVLGDSERKENLL